MISPTAIRARALAVIDASRCIPNNWRSALVNPTPEVKAAWAARQSLDALFHAREYLWFIQAARNWSPARSAHNYRSHRQHQRIARSCIRSAGRHLSDAERLLAMREEQRRAA